LKLKKESKKIYKKLFCSGPTNVSEDVSNKMADLLIRYRTKEASKLQRNISGELKKLMYTENEIILSTSSACGLMEGAMRSYSQRYNCIF
jgi:aspartate aminotransferase-like enzyme